MRDVLVVGKYYPPMFGGIESITKQCAEALSVRHKVVVVCFNEKNKTEIERYGNVTIVRCATPFIVFRQPISFVMAAKIVGCKADLVHFHAPNFWGAALVALFKPKSPLLVSHHADVEGRKTIRRLVMPIYTFMLRRASRVIVSSLKNIKFSTDLRCDRRKVAEIPFGLNADAYVVREQSIDPPVDTGKVSLHFGFCGRLVWYKGLDVLLRAFQPIAGAKLSIVGDGPLRGEIEALAGKLGLQDRVVFHGCVSEARKLELLRELDVFVFPSTHITETFGISQMEAQMCGIPCITSNLPTGVSDVVENGVTGLLVEPGNASKLEDAMRLMIRDPEFRLLCGRDARARAMRCFSETAFGESFRSLVDKILEDDGPSRIAPALQRLPNWRTNSPRRIGGA